jgi:5'-3' exonuclease
MKRLNSRLKDHQWPFKMTLSDSTEQGEGEHKIMKLIVEKKDPNLSHVIYGMDGDLIMLSLISDKKIYLFRDQHGKSDQNTRMFLDIQRLKNGIVSHVKSTVELEELNGSQILFDYLVMCFLLGNDFLPTFADLSILGNGIELLEKAYQALISKGYYLTNNTLPHNRPCSGSLNSVGKGTSETTVTFSRGTLNIDCTFTINFEGLDVFIKSLSRSKQGRKSTVFKDISLIQELKSRNVHVNIESHFIKTKELYNIYYDLDNKKNVVTEWIRGLEWVLGYYQQHSHQNWTWFYPYENAPHIHDVLDMRVGSFQPTNFEKTNPFSELQQLFMVLPKSSFKDNLFLTNLSESVYFKKFFPSVLCLDAINKMYLWQCKPIGLPQFDENIIRTVLK